MGFRFFPPVGNHLTDRAEAYPNKQFLTRLGHRDSLAETARLG
jgi:hypothetical protein